MRVRTGRVCYVTNGRGTCTTEEKKKRRKEKDSVETDQPWKLVVGRTIYPGNARPYRSASPRGRQFRSALIPKSPIPSPWSSSWVQRQTSLSFTFSTFRQFFSPLLNFVKHCSSFPFFFFHCWRLTFLVKISSFDHFAVQTFFLFFETIITLCKFFVLLRFTWTTNDVNVNYFTHSVSHFAIQREVSLFLNEVEDWQDWVVWFCDIWFRNSLLTVYQWKLIRNVCTKEMILIDKFDVSCESDYRFNSQVTIT